MKTKPLISIITVSYNAKKTIEQTILSVLNQTYKNIEYIIIDGKSTDGTVDIIKKYEKRISYWVSEKDTGIYNAMNKGIKIAHGVLIGIVNADDFYEKDAVEIMVDEYTKKGTEADRFLYYGMLRIWKHELEFCVRQYHHNFVTETAIQHPTCFVPKVLYDKWGGFDEQYRVCADFDLLNRYRANGVRFCKVDKIISNFRIGGATTKLANEVIMEPPTIRLKYGIITQEEFNKIAKWHKKMVIRHKIKQLLLFWKKI